MTGFFRIFSFLIILLFALPMEAQSFRIDENKKKFSLPYKQVNNLIIIPLTLNGVQLSFLLDTGVDKSILFSLDKEDSLEINNTSFIYLRGLGLGKPIRAIQSEGNEVRIGKATNKNFPLYVIFDHEVNFSDRMGVPIHGIIGYDFFKDFIVQMDYTRKNLKIYDPEFYNYKNCRKCEDFPMELRNNKPYIEVSAHVNDQKTSLNLLVDSGSGDALWLFQNRKNISVPIKSFEDHLGYTLSGGVHGFRSRITQLDIGNHKLGEVTCSFPDTSYTNKNNFPIYRDGTIGSQILKRFKVIVDYKNGKLRLKPNRNFKEPFEYDMSGIVLAHSGFSIVKKVDPPVDRNMGKDLLKANMPQVKFSLEPEYQIMEVRPNSPAQKAGVQTGDVLLAVNGKKAYRYSLSQLISFFQSENGKRIKLLIERDGVEQKIFFNLERVL